ncbi:MAG: DUF177 domain-containing protein [Thermodesulfobacteriota bacterium]|nr:DUF177 domain-containing protein [Thermodesulfobacteriota bacterium]
MKIDLTNIPSEGKYIKFNLTPEGWEPDFGNDHIIGLSGPLSGWIKAYLTGRKVAVEGVLSTSLKLRCDRCLESYDEELSTKFRFFLSLIPYEGNLDIELSENDIDINFIDGKYLDSDQIIREQIVFNVPVKAICSTDCKGLCPVCGCNLNIETCSCSAKAD